MTSSIAFAAKLRMSSKSASLRDTNSPTVLNALALEAVVGTDREVEVLDRQREIGGQRGVGRRRADVDALGLDVQLAGQTEQLDERLAGAGDGVARTHARLVSTSTMSLSKSVRCSTRVASTL